MTGQNETACFPEGGESLAASHASTGGPSTPLGLMENQTRADGAGSETVAAAAAGDQTAHAARAAALREKRPRAQRGKVAVAWLVNAVKQLAEPHGSAPHDVAKFAARALGLPEQQLDLPVRLGLARAQRQGLLQRASAGKYMIANAADMETAGCGVPSPCRKRVKQSCRRRKRSCSKRRKRSCSRPRRRCKRKSRSRRPHPASDPGCQRACSSATYRSRPSPPALSSTSCSPTPESRSPFRRPPDVPRRTRGRSRSAPVSRRSCRRQRTVAKERRRQLARPMPLARPRTSYSLEQVVSSSGATGDGHRNPQCLVLMVPIHAAAELGRQRRGVSWSRQRNMKAVRRCPYRLVAKDCGTTRIWRMAETSGGPWHIVKDTADGKRETRKWPKTRTPRPHPYAVSYPEEMQNQRADENRRGAVDLNLDDGWFKDSRRCSRKRSIVIENAAMKFLYKILSKKNIV